MFKWQDMKEAVDGSLAELKAGEELRQRIMYRVAQGEQPAFRPRLIWIPALACILVLAIALAAALPRITRNESLLPVSRTAGDAGVGRDRADLGNGNVEVGSRNAPAYRSIWASGSGSAFPLIRYNGRWYRLLTEPSQVSGSVLGNSVGQVEEYTTEPTLSGSGGIVSNAVQAGSTVYAISGMEGTLLAAEVSGSMRAFQRVSFNGGALIGSEQLRDSLNISGHVRTLELSDVGTIIDSGTAEQLIGILLNSASFEGTGSVSGSQSLIITLDNGLKLQLSVKGSRFGACGVWNCPDFFEQFQNAL